MSQESGRLDGVSRRKFLVTTGAAGAIGLAGCSSGSGGDGGGSDGSSDGGDSSSGDGSSGGSSSGDGSSGGSSSGDGSSGDGSSGDGSDGASTGGDGGSMSSDPLESGGSSTVYPVANTAASYWNANRPASDTEYWPHKKYGIETDLPLADYWGSLYGFKPGDKKKPPFRWTVGLSHSGTGVRKVRDGIYDIGNSSGRVQDELPDRNSYEKFKDHVVAVDGQPLVVSSEIKKAGVTKITGQELKDLYKGRITNWSTLGGPDKPIRVLGRVKDSGTRTAFVSNTFDNPKEDTQVANRYGQNQRLAQAIAQADNAISYLALAFLNTAGVEPIALEWKGTTYKYKDPQNGLDSKNYPLSRDLHMYTWEGTSMKEAAVINMMLSKFGQDTFVAPNNYFTLGKRRRKKQREKLPDQVK